MVDADLGGPELPPSILDPWLAQITYGYCPPEGIHFARHTPPTNFPGREQDTSRTPTGGAPAVTPPLARS